MSPGGDHQGGESKIFHPRPWYFHKGAAHGWNCPPHGAFWNSSGLGTLLIQGAHFPGEKEVPPIVGSVTVLQPRYPLVIFQVPGFKLY